MGRAGGREVGLVPTVWMGGLWGSAWSGVMPQLPPQWDLEPALAVGEVSESDFILGGSKITTDGDCSHEIKRSPVPGILQARTLEWVAISFSKA